MTTPENDPKNITKLFDPPTGGDTADTAKDQEPDKPFDGGPAFPQVQLLTDGKTGKTLLAPMGGMSLRAYFAGQNLAAGFDVAVAVKKADELIAELEN